MEEFEQDVPVSEQKSSELGEVADEAAESTGEALDDAGIEEPEESEKSEPEQIADDATEPRTVEAEIVESLTRTKVICRLKAIVIELEGGSLVVDGVPVGELADEVDFELEYSVKNGRHELEIELEW